MSIERFVCKEVETLPEAASCSEAAVLMRDCNIGCVVVTDGERPLGLVTDRDLVVRVLAEGLDPEEVQVGDMMSDEPICVHYERSLGEAVALMRAQTVRRVPVVDRNGDLVGILSLDDVLPLLSDELADAAAVIRRESEARP